MSNSTSKNGGKTSWGSVILPDMDASDWQRIGEALKQARELNQKDLGSLAQQLCLSTNQVKALELGTGKVFHGDSIRFACARRYAALLGLDAGQVNVKAKTAEKMGPVGEGKAMQAQAVVLLLPL